MAGLASSILPCCLYFIYASAYVIFCILTQLNISSDIYEAVVEPFERGAWRQDPEKRVEDIANGEEVYQWIETVFLSNIYEENVGSSDDYYCTEVYPCLLNEGPSRVNETCAEFLTVGEMNCPSFAGSSSHCCTTCIGADCPNTTLQLAGCSLETNTSVPNLAENCADEMPSWLPYLATWPQDSGYEHPNPAASCPSSNDGTYQFCPERLERKSPLGRSRRPKSTRYLTISHFNQVVYGRITMKRLNMVQETAAAFINAYPFQPEGGTLDPFVPSSNDNRSSFGEDHLYSYEENKGFRNTGGFIYYIDFNKTQLAIKNELATLKRNHWFDLRQGTFVLELLIYNGNYETFLYVQFVFQHLYNGMGQVSVEAYPLNMSILNADLASEFYPRYIMLAIMVAGLVYFVKSELDDMSAEPGAYVSNPVNILHIVSMSLSFVGLVYWFVTIYSYTYTTTGLPFPDQLEGQIETFQSLVDLAQNMHIFLVVSSINICLIIMRSITLLAQMTPYSNVIFATLGLAMKDMGSFMLVFTSLFAGFMFGGFYLCGTRVPTFNSLSQSFVSCLQMVMSFSNYSNIVRGDPTIGIFYFYCFHLFFIITQNLLLSIICGAYNEERKCLEDPNVASRYPLQRFVKASKMASRDVSSWITKMTAGVVGYLFGSTGGSAIRVNTESINRLNDKRAGSRPIKRKVEYTQKNEDEYDRRYPDKDMKLVAKTPLYRDGLMNFYVEAAIPEGLAAESGVGQDYRLVCIKMQGQEDRRGFRDPEKFKREPTNEDGVGFCNDTTKFLETLKENLPVTLEFEGKISMFTVGCAYTGFFVLATCLFFNFATRVEDGYNIFQVQSQIIKDTHWSTYNPTELRNLNMVSKLGDLDGWAKEAIGNQYACVTSINDPPPCISTASSSYSDLPSNFVRSNYVLWAGSASGTLMFGPPDGVQFTPPSVQGQSLGYIPWSGIPGGDPSWSSQMESVARVRDYNVGFMPNNFVRMTMQMACFKENPKKQFARGVPFVLQDVIRDSSGCAEDDCMKRMIEDLNEKGDKCYSLYGSPRDPREFTGAVSGVSYAYTEDGTFNNLGGIAIGMGATRTEASMIASIAQGDAIFADPAANSMVFEYAVYNANMDMFSYTTVAISLLPTGKVYRHITVTSFPLTLFSMGSGQLNEGAKIMCYVLLGLFALCVVSSIGSFLYDLFIEFRLNSENQKNCLWFIPSFFINSWWNFLDLGTIIVNIFTIVSLCQFVLIGARDGSFDTWTTSEYRFSTAVTESTKDPFDNFAEAAFYYRCFTTGGGFSTLLICLRSIKYFVVIQQMQLVIMTIVASFWELYYMLLILIMSLMAFAFMFHTRFAIVIGDKFATLDRSFCQLFLYMVGQFDTATTFEASPTYFVITFTMVQIVFYFLLSNMFLATLVYKWKYTRKDAQDDVKSTFMKLYYSMPCCRNRKGATVEDIKKRSLDRSFWKECSVLNYLERFDEYGKIRDNVPKPTADGVLNGTEAPMDLEDIFRRAHMEIASKMCRALTLRNDSGGGMSKLMDDQQEDMVGDEEAGDYVGIIELEDKVEDSTANKIKQDLEEKFKQEESHAWEIWLDALTTVLEDHGLLEKLQRFFLPQQMIKPRSSQEWGKFDQLKVKMEKRLDLFLGLMLEETYIAHYRYLRESAKTKQKVLKQQSLVLADYLDQLDFNIKELQEEIKVLDRRNGEMRSHVQPLL